LSSSSPFEPEQKALETQLLVKTGNLIYPKVSSCGSLAIRIGFRAASNSSHLIFGVNPPVRSGFGCAIAFLHLRENESRHLPRTSSPCGK
jgi:hypothetical protein